MSEPVQINLSIRTPVVVIAFFECQETTKGVQVSPDEKPMQSSKKQRSDSDATFTDPSLLLIKIENKICKSASSDGISSYLGH
jgi:hypothetical protein